MSKEVAERTEAATAAAEQAVDAGGNVSLAEFASRLSQSAKTRASTTAPAAEGADAQAEVPEDGAQATDGDPSAEAETDGQGEQAAGAEAEGKPENDGTEGERGGEGEGEPEGDAEPDESTDVPKGFEKMQKRIDTLTANWRAAQERIAELESKAGPGKEGEARQEPRPTVNGNEAHPSLKGLNSDIATMTNVLRWTKENPEGGVWTDADGTKTEVDADRAQALREYALTEKSRLVARRESISVLLEQNLAQQQASYEAEALTAYPWLGKTPKDEAGTAKRQEFETYVSMLPEIRRHPDYKTWIADAMAGREARLAKAKAGAMKAKVGGTMVKPKSQGGQPAPITGRPGAAAPRVNGAQKTVQVARAEFEKSGTTRSFAKVLSASAAARKSSR